MLEQLQPQHNLSNFPGISVCNFAAQQPLAFEDKQMLLGRPLHAQPENSVTNAMSDSGAALSGKQVRSRQETHALRKMNEEI